MGGELLTYLNEHFCVWCVSCVSTCPSAHQSNICFQFNIIDYARQEKRSSWCMKLHYPRERYLGKFSNDILC